MSPITGTEPNHWHTTGPDGAVHHRMTDPRTLDMPAVHWSADERDYAAHLQAHEAAARRPTPREDDHEVVSTVLAYALNEEKRIATLRELALTARAELATGVLPERSRAIAALATVWRAVHSGTDGE